MKVLAVEGNHPKASIPADSPQQWLEPHACILQSELFLLTLISEHTTPRVQSQHPMRGFPLDFRPVGRSMVCPSKASVTTSNWSRPAYELAVHARGVACGASHKMIERVAARHTAIHVKSLGPQGTTTRSWDSIAAAVECGGIGDD